MPHFLFISTKSDWGGSEPLWSDAAERAFREGYQVTIVIPQPEQCHQRYQELRTVGIKFLTRPPRAGISFGTKVIRKIQGETRDWEITWWQKQFPVAPDAICVSQGGAYCLINMPGLAHWLLDISSPFILVGHSHRPYALPPIKSRGQIRQVFEKAHKVCLVAEDHVRAVRRFLGIKLPNAIVVQNPVNLKEEKAKIDLTTEGTEEAAGLGLAVQAGVAFLNPSTSELARDSENTSLIHSANAPRTSVDRSTLAPGPSLLLKTLPTMACVARFEVRDKGQDLLLEALADPVWRERDFRLDFYGSGSDREVLEDLISFYDLGDKVRIVGFESNIVKIWEEHELLVLPSLSEGTPISLIEAQLCRRASLVTRVDGIPEWVEEGKTGFLAEAPAVYHLGLALERAWENRHCWSEMGEAARAACLAKRDPDPAGTLLVLLKATAQKRR